MESPLGLRLGAEALGTFLFFFLGFTSIAVLVDLGPGAISTLGIAFAFGLGLALAITAFGHVSGGHFNPAVSLGLAAARKFPPREVVPYWIAQLAGGFVAVSRSPWSSRAPPPTRSTPRRESASRTVVRSCSR